MSLSEDHAATGTIIILVTWDAKRATVKSKSSCYWRQCQAPWSCCSWGLCYTEGHRNHIRWTGSGIDDSCFSLDTVLEELVSWNGLSRFDSTPCLSEAVPVSQTDHLGYNPYPLLGCADYSNIYYYWIFFTLAMLWYTKCCGWLFYSLSSIFLFFSFLVGPTTQLPHKYKEIFAFK